MKATVGEFTREIIFGKAHDERNAGYGIKPVYMWFLLHGAKGVMQFALSSGSWYPRNVRDERRDKHDVGFLDHPMAIDIGYHAPAQQYEGQTTLDCEYLPEGKCYYDGSTLQAGPVMDMFFVEGEESIWRRLEGEYRARFGDDS